MRFSDTGIGIWGAGVKGLRIRAGDEPGTVGQGNGVTCRAVAESLPRIVDGGEVADLAVQRHVAGCLRCQAELAQYRKLLRTLHQLRTEVLQPAPGLLPDILASLEAASERQAMHFLLTGRRGAYMGGIAVATAAGAAGAIVLATRAKHRRPHMAG